jgi:hypothetical protein
MVFNATFNNISVISWWTIHLATLHIPRRHLRKRKSWTIVGLFYIPLKFQPKMKNWIYHLSTGFLNYTRFLSNSTILLGLPNAPRNLTTSSGISYQLRDICSICRCCWNVAAYEWKVHNGKIEILIVLTFR